MEIGTREWGQYEVLQEEENFKLKRITVKPGQKLSYQYHSKREEIWTCIKGEGVIVLDDVEQMFLPGDVVHIPLGAKHRIGNCCAEDMQRDLVFTEVQLGTYFGEDDIVRISDMYGRVDPGYDESVL